MRCLHVCVLIAAVLLAVVSQTRKETFSIIWNVLSPGIDAELAPVKSNLLAGVHGNVLELGCALGVNLKYYDPKVNMFLFAVLY